MPRRSRHLPPSRAAILVACALGVVISAIMASIAYIAANDAMMAVFLCFGAVFVGGCVWAITGAAAHAGASRSSQAAMRSSTYLGALLFFGLLGSMVILVGVYLIVVMRAFVPAIYLPVGAILLAAVVAQAGQFIRRRRAMLALSYVEQGVRLDLPLPRLIFAAARTETKTLRARLLNLHDALEEGEPIDRALDQTVPEMPGRVIRAAAAAERIGRLPHVLRQIMAGWKRQDPGSESLSFYRAYPLAMIVIFVCVVTAEVVFVLPKFESIARDFHVYLPASTRLLIRIANLFSDTTLGGTLFILILTAVVICLGHIFWTIFGSMQNDPIFQGGLADYFTWWFPGLGGYLRDAAMADAFDFLADALGAARPLHEALRETAEAQGNAVLRYRLRGWAAAVASGASLTEGASYAAMPSLVVGMLSVPRDTEHLVETLTFLSRHYRFRFIRARAIIQSLYVPIIVFIMAAFVTLVALGIFEPMQVLVRAVSLPPRGI